MAIIIFQGKKIFIDRGPLEPELTQNTMEILLKQVQDLKLEVDILKETINVLKKIKVLI